MSEQPAEEEVVPRKPIETSPESQLWAKINEVARAVSEMQRASSLRNASISGGTGIRLLAETSAEGEAGGLRIWISPDGTITAYNLDNGAPAVRMGRMIETGGIAGNDPYGIEVFVGGQWVQLGNQTVTWDNIQGKPSTFPVASHQHPGNQITSAVANATNAANANTANSATTATTAGRASHAEGSDYAYNNPVAGSNFYAVWVGNDGGFHLGRNTSSQRYKENIRYDTVPDKSILGVKVCLFDRKNGGPKNEFGVIAEQAHEHFPEATQYFDGKIDGVRYDLYGAALIPIVKEHDDRLAKLEALVQTQAAEISRLREQQP